MKAYADTSFVGSLYLQDSNSGQASERLRAFSPPLLLSSLGELELINAIELHLFRKELPESDITTALASFRADVESGVVAIRPMTESMYTEARRLSSRWTPTLGARSLDILQVAAALVLKADVFVTFDERQKKLAKAAGLVCR